MRLTSYPEIFMQSANKSLASSFQDLITRMDKNREEIDRFALAQHMYDSQQYYETSERLHHTTQG
jgi:hypothetical protein